MFKQRQMLVKVARRRVLLAASRPSLPHAVGVAVSTVRPRCLSSIPRPMFNEDDDPHAEAWKAKKESLRQMLEKTKKSTSLVDQREMPTAKESLQKNAQAEEDVRLVSPSELKYTGESVIPITTQLHIVKPGEDVPRGIWPVFRMMVSSL